MATRKSRQNTESPTPSGAESVPTTPTTPATRNTRSIRNKQLQLGKPEETAIQIKTEKIDEEEEAVKEASIEEEATAPLTDTPAVSDAKEATEQTDKETSPPAVSTRKRRTAATKEEGVSDKPATSTETASPNSPDDGKTSPTKIKRSRRSAFELLTDCKTEITPSILSKRRNSTGKIEKPTRKLSSRIKKLKQLRKTPLGKSILKKPEKLAALVNKPIKQLIEKQATKGAKIEKSDSASDSELIKMSRRRSDSVSKCSDITDASSFHEHKGSVEDLLTQSSELSDEKVEVKEEVIEKDEVELKPENELIESGRIANDSGIGGDSDNSQAVKVDGDQGTDGKRASRFPRRGGKKPLNPPRVMNTRSRSETPSKAASENQEEDEEPIVLPEKGATDSPLRIDTSEANADGKLSPNAEQKANADDENKSLSPVLVSEGVSEISVKQFYGRADFLENNLGIEKDPKLGEIVQSQEKIKSGNKENSDTDASEKTEKDCGKSSAESEVVELDASNECMEVDENADDDGAKCDEKDAKDSEPSENTRRDSVNILNENLLVLNGEIELTSTKEKKDVAKSPVEDVSEVVLYKISNGMRVNPEKLETVLESQKLKEKERSDSTESTESPLIIEETENADKMETDVKNVNKAKEQPVQADTKVNEVSDTKPAPVRFNAGSKDSRSSSLDDESPEERIQKESHLKTLGLLTHQAAEEATIEKQKQREKIKANKGKKNSEYTGTLKTVIKLHRGNDKKKGNQSIKLTLHKGRAKNGSDKSDSHSIANSEEDTYYTIHQQDMDSIDQEADEAAAKEHEKLLVIPEKASSFRYHPEKICEDQCFYCGGKFGLFDTPCHIAQIKSAERQKKILDYEAKLTVDSCLCDACFRHVDRHANCPSYKKRQPETVKIADATGDDAEEKDYDSALFHSNREVTFCQVHECTDQAAYSVSRKWVLKLRRTVNKLIQFNMDTTNSMAFLPICDKHYDDVNHLMVCILCNRRLKRNHCYFMSQESTKIESLIANEGIQVPVGNKSVACKLCRYYVNLLLRPQEAKKAEFVRDYKKRLLESHGIIDREEDSEDSGNHETTSKRAKRNRKSLNDEENNTSRSAKVAKPNDAMDLDAVSIAATRTRQKNKQLSQQQLMEEQQRVEKRVQMKQKEMMLQQQKMQEEMRQKQVRSSNEDISNLRSNPNISMRELLPGEEEMGLHVNLPFANSWRTPDGWTKVTSTVQYDEPTRRLWEDLQKPYGNQSSFLRHLLLLEKYFRSGDLLLTQNANINAITYAESVQHRLQAYDNIPPRPISFAQLLPQGTSDLVKSVTTANKAVTISKVNAKPSALSITANPKPSDNASNSLLKSNVTNNASKSRNYTVTTESINGSETAKAMNNPVGVTSTPKNKNPGLPPELICISTPNDKQSSALPPSYQLQMQLTLQQQIQQQHQNSLLLSQQTKQLLQNMVPTMNSNSTGSLPKKQTTPNKSPNNQNNSANKSNVIRLPDALTDAERRDSKNWRPTLMPVSTDKTNAEGQMYQTADGRRLPYFVQVQSGGKPYMISIHDYNRMCILRRERLLKDQTDLIKNKSNQSGSFHNSSSSQKSDSVNNSLSNSVNAKTTVIDVDKLSKSLGSSSSNSAQVTSKVQVPNKILEQNSLIPINSKSNENSTSKDSLLRFRFSKSKSSLLKSNAVASQPKPVVPQQLVPPNASVTATVIPPNPLAKIPISFSNALSQSNVVSITSTPTTSAILGMAQAATPPPISIIPTQTQPITITSVPSGNSSASQSTVSSLEALFRNTSQATTMSPKKMFQWAEQLNKMADHVPIDTSASSILSKIPKSLTVIPQQKNLAKGSDE